MGMNTAYYHIYIYIYIHKYWRSIISYTQPNEALNTEKAPLRPARSSPQPNLCHGEIPQIPADINETSQLSWTHAWQAPAASDLCQAWCIRFSNPKKQFHQCQHNRESERPSNAFRVTPTKQRNWRPGSFSPTLPHRGLWLDICNSTADCLD